MSDLRKRRAEEKEQRREAIVDAAEAVFTRRGYDAAKMEDVARQARVSRALVYLYFRSKDELYFALCVRALHKLREIFLAASAAAPTGYEKILAIGRAYAAFADDSPCYFEALSRLEMHQPGKVAPDSIERAALEAGKAVHAVTIAALDQGRRDGSLRGDLGDPLMTALSLWAFSHGMVQLARTKRHFLADVGVDVDRFVESARQLAMRGLAPAESAAPARRRR